MLINGTGYLIILMQSLLTLILMLVKMSAEMNGCQNMQKLIMPITLRKKCIWAIIRIRINSIDTFHLM